VALVTAAVVAGAWAGCTKLRGSRSRITGRSDLQTSERLFFLRAAAPRRFAFADDLRGSPEYDTNNASRFRPFLQSFGGNGMPEKSAKLSANGNWARRTFALLLVVLGPALLTPRALFAQDDAIKQISTDTASVISGAGKKTVSVDAFTDLDGNVTELGRFLSSEFSDDLAAQAKGFMVIDRAQSQGASSPSSVESMVSGSLTPFADHVRLAVKVLDATNSAILGTASVDIPRTKDIDDLLARSPSSAPAKSSMAAKSAPAPASNSASTSTTASEGPLPAVAGTPASAKTPRHGSTKPPKNAPVLGTPSASGMGSVSTDTYRVTAVSFAHAGGTATLTLEFDGLSESTVQLAIVRTQTYLIDETGVRWTLNQTDTAGIFNAHDGFWRGVPIKQGTKIQTVLTFSPQGPIAGTKFTLNFTEFRPKWNRVLAINGLQ
jgi:hypothetical protein